MIKKLTGFIIQPFKLISHRSISEKISLFFIKRPFWIYIFSFIVTAAIVYFAYSI